MKRRFPKVHSKSNEVLKPLRIAGDEAQRFHREFDCAEAWACFRQWSGPSDVSVWIPHEPGNVLHTHRIEGELDVPAEFQLVFMNEITLFNV